MILDIFLIWNDKILIVYCMSFCGKDLKTLNIAWMENESELPIFIGGN